MSHSAESPEFSRLAIGLGLITAPVWLAQGAYVRRFTPRLPEPEGERSGEVGPGEGFSAVNVLIAGDSAAAGVGAGHQQRALSGQLVSLLAESINVRWSLVARTGFDCCQLIEQLEQIPTTRFDIAVISIGVNDVTGGRRTAQWCASLALLTEILRVRFGVRSIIYSPLPPMHRFSALPQPLRWLMGQRARHFNDVLARHVACEPGCVPLALDYPLTAGYLAHDGFHPGEPAYAFWAQRIASAIIAATGS